MTKPDDKLVAERSFAWTKPPGTYRHYPPFVNLTGNRLTVRGVEDLTGEYPQVGATVSVDLPDEAFAELATALMQSQRASMEQLEVEAECLRNMREIAQGLGYPSVLEALEATPRASMEGEITSEMVDARLSAARKVGLYDAPVTIIYQAMRRAALYRKPPEPQEQPE